MNEIKLIALYYYICECYNTALKWHCQRFSNYSGDEITDEEIITIYLFAIIEEEKYKITSNAGQLLGQHGIDLEQSLIDSFPIITCSAKRKGKVAPELTNKGYCATKELHYYGVKLHAMAFSRVNTIPFPEFIKITPASENDLNAFREILKTTTHRSFIADKAYSDKELRKIAKEND